MLALIMIQTKGDCYTWLLLLLDKLHSSIGWLTGSRIFILMLCIQMQVQVLPVATLIMLVCRNVVRYHGEWFNIACVHMAHTGENRNVNKEQREL